MVSTCTTMERSNWSSLTISSQLKITNRSLLDHTVKNFGLWCSRKFTRKHTEATKRCALGRPMKFSMTC